MSLKYARLGVAARGRVVRRGGSSVVAVLAYARSWSQQDVVNHRFRRYTRPTLEAAARAAGWRTVSSTHFNGLLLPAAVIHRGLQRVRPPSDETLSDLERTPGRLNRPLEMPLVLEARLIARGGRVPVGVSLVGVFAWAGGARAETE